MGVTRSHGVGIFTKQESLTVFPENHHLADTAACHSMSNILLIYYFFYQKDSPF